MYERGEREKCSHVSFMPVCVPMCTYNVHYVLAQIATTRECTTVLCLPLLAHSPGNNNGQKQPMHHYYFFFCHTAYSCPLSTKLKK